MTANQIIPGLWIGDIDDAARFRNGKVLSVLENMPTIFDDYHVAIVSRYRKEKERWNGRTFSFPVPVVSVDRLDKAAHIIDQCQKKGEPLLVHCRVGIERSPLTVAWWLVRSGRAKNLDQAYNIIKKRRPQVVDRQDWVKWT